MLAVADKADRVDLGERVAAVDRIVVVHGAETIAVTDRVVAVTDRVVAVTDRVVAVTDRVVAVTDRVVAVTDGLGSLKIVGLDGGVDKLRVVGFVDCVARRAVQGRWRKWKGRA
jgi:hypothetical protein